MSFTKHYNELNNYHNALKAMESPSHLKILVRNALSDITENCQLFDTCISCDSPFYNEFFHLIILQKTQNIDDDSCLELFECLCIFFREKRLRFGYSKLTESEKNIMSYFENSEHWNQDVNTIIGSWYWQVLPQKIINESMESNR